MPDLITNNTIRQWLYPFTLFIIYVCWLLYMFGSNSWYLVGEWWPMSLTMLLGSFVAGASAEGGAAVAFPIFTKLLQIPATDARTFGLMIQAVGMTMASMVIIARRVRILPGVIGWVSLGGLMGMISGSLLTPIPPPYPKILFTFVTVAFGLALALSRWGLRWQPHDEFSVDRWPRKILFVVIGITGGFFAANTGSGIDTLTFIVLTLTFGINEKISTPTTVVIMGLNSVVGFAMHGLVIQQIGVVWEYWLVCIPIVILGAPLGAWAASLVNRDVIIYLLLTLITMELISTIILIPFTSAMITVTWITMIICTVGFTVMLIYRHKQYTKTLPAELEPALVGNGDKQSVQGLQAG